MTASALNPRNVLGIGIDITYQSISLILKRLQDRYPDDWPQIEAHIKPDGKKTEKAIVEVKGGGTGVNDVGRLAQVMEREGAKIGVLITAQLPTRAMEADAAAVGIWENDPLFGYAHFVHNLPPFLMKAPEWNVRFITDDVAPVDEGGH